MTRPGIEPWSPGPLANTLLIRPMAYYYTDVLILLQILLMKEATYLALILHFLSVNVAVVR